MEINVVSPVSDDGDKIALYAGIPQEAKSARISTNGQSAGNLAYARESSTTIRATLAHNHEYDILVVVDREEVNRKQRERRKANGNLYTHRYEKTVNGFLMRMYRNMESRVRGIQKLKFHLYQGKELWDRAIFYEWAKKSVSFLRLWEAWVKSGYNRKLTPTVDRINPLGGYNLSNVEWVTHSENSRRGSLSQLRRKKKI